MVGAMDAGAWWLLWLIGTGISMAIASAAGRGRGSAWWGLLGPVGWIIAAIQSTSEAPAAPPGSARRAADTAVLRCVGCREPIQPGRVLCFLCGASQE